MVLAKIEGTYGTDPTPTASANVIAVSRSSVKYGPKFQHIMRQILDGTFDGVAGQNVLPEVSFGFSVELRGNRTDGTANDISNGLSAEAIEIDCLLQACDLAPTYTAATVPGTSRDGFVTYNPIVPTTPGASVTFYFFTGLKKHIVTGCKGTMKLNMTAGQFGMIDFRSSPAFTTRRPTRVCRVRPCS